MNKWGQASRVRKLSPFGHGWVAALGPAALENADCTPKPVTENRVRADRPARGLSAGFRRLRQFPAR
ncbi:hypothetical protein, partial [Ralstonia pseudosolanacearum]|uniref:hypothetical protein n=1 Tax=Ralstonia pseudosolanacearum TaxID=1310165 RepID=UPI003221CDC9